MKFESITIDSLIRQSSKLSSLPEIYQQICRALDDEGSTSLQISAIIRNDPAIAARVLKTVNSAFYGFPSQIATIEQAVSLMGRNPLRNLLTTVILTRVISQLNCVGFAMEEFWQHSIRTGLIARNCYASLTSREEAEPLFIAGLIHDIGSLIIAQFAPQLYAAANETSIREANNIELVEERLAGFNHARLGAELLLEWELPPILIACCKYHHSPKSACDFTQAVWIVAIANRLSRLDRNQFESGLGDELEQIKDWQASDTSQEQWNTACKIAEEQISEVIVAFNL